MKIQDTRNNNQTNSKFKIRNSDFGHWSLVIGYSLMIVSCFLVIAPPVFAAGQAGLDIAVLKAGVGARPLGMGGAFTAIADNADAPYWNPAGLSQIKQQEINTMQTKLSTDTDHYYISYVRPLGRGTLGISWIQVGIGTITQTSATLDAWNEVQTINVFSYFSNAYMLSYGLPLNPNISVGMTAKYLTSDMFQIAGGQAYGYSITPGLLLVLRSAVESGESLRVGSQASAQRQTPYVSPDATTQRPMLALGIKIDELLNEQSWGTGTTEKVPAKARLGVAIRPAKGLLNNSTLALDLAQTLKSNYAAELSAGYEWSKDGLSLRAGYTESVFTAGAGFKSGVAQIDYAYVQQTSLSKENVHRISLSGKW